MVNILTKKLRLPQTVGTWVRMSRKNRSEPITPVEIAATIARSDFPSVITEGKDDVIVFRRLEEEFSDLGLTLIPAGGRRSVIEVYRLRHTLPKHARAVFIADRDLWVVGNIPDEFVSPRFLFTDGYSIENDMFRDGELSSLLTAAERRKFYEELKLTCRWYALEIARHQRGEEINVGIPPDHLIDNLTEQARMLKLRDGEAFPDDLSEHILQEHAKILRGKTLFALLIRQLNGLNYLALLNIGASRKGPHLTTLFQDVRTCLCDV
jgi:hypothetical protein